RSGGIPGRPSSCWRRWTCAPPRQTSRSGSLLRRGRQGERAAPAAPVETLGRTSHYHRELRMFWLSTARVSSPAPISIFVLLIASTTASTGERKSSVETRPSHRAATLPVADRHASSTDLSARRSERIPLAASASGAFEFAFTDEAR